MSRSSVRPLLVGTLVVCACSVARVSAQSAVPPSAGISVAEAAAGWRSLFDGKTLTGWTTVGEAKWTVTDAALTANPSLQASPPPSGSLRTTETFSDFELKAEFFAAENANSGLFIRRGGRPRAGAARAGRGVNIM